MRRANLKVGKHIVTEPRAVATGLGTQSSRLLVLRRAETKQSGTTAYPGPVATARGSVTTALFSYLLLIGALAELRLGFTGEALVINFCGRGTRRQANMR